MELVWPGDSIAQVRLFYEPQLGIIKFVKTSSLAHQKETGSYLPGLCLD